MTGYAAAFSKQADIGLTCTTTSVVYANYVDSTVLLSIFCYSRLIQYLKIINFAEEHYSLRDKCTITSVVYANYVDSTILLSAVTID